MGLYEFTSVGVAPLIENTIHVLSVSIEFNSGRNTKNLLGILIFNLLLLFFVSYQGGEESFFHFVS